MQPPPSATNARQPAGAPVGAVALRKQDIIHRPLNSAKKWVDKYNPGRTKYESRDKLLKPLEGLIIPEIAFKQRNP